MLGQHELRGAEHAGGGGPGPSLQDIPGGRGLTSAGERDHGRITSLDSANNITSWYDKIFKEHGHTVDYIY